ncbi:putative ABC transport system permease protein [Carnobacterium iners]|uniref:Putative ABC transport system permease protein n=1 Tax=Carnobacterium iners TaxID=1073423 RepID=A0A1X7NRL4_9LACT|nr:ABC transporter permease [Carnobacterium iners]SEK88268.1 putative ABC transport system permease protein [Carnobacterium iners]SMH40725.1 putative ABC transport system permease protein [Carnobacterium iners]
MSIILSSISQGLLWSIMAIGVYLTFRILDIADLTAEGSFPLGAAVCASLIVAGLSPLLATFIAMFCGMLAGAISGLLHTKLKIPALLTGILTMTGLYSINLRIMGKANVTLLGKETLMRTVQSYGLTSRMSVLIVGLFASLLVIFLLYLFFNTETGLAIRSTGDNEAMSEANGINTNAMKIIGYMLSNGLIALSGALIAQNNSYADIGMGIGTIVIGLASVIIGEVLFRQLSFAKRLLTIVIGSIVYRLIIDLVLQLGIDPQDIKLFSALILAIALSTPLIKKKTKVKLKNTTK